MPSNLPSGWVAFRALRRASAKPRPTRHGNWKHGGQSRAGLEQERKLRLVLRLLDAPRRCVDDATHLALPVPAEAGGVGRLCRGAERAEQ
jgi:hypothetical protein